MTVLPYNPSSELDDWPVAFSFNYWSAERERFHAMASRWQGEEMRLAAISKLIFSQNDQLWDRLLTDFHGREPIANLKGGGGGISNSKSHHDYVRDLRGLKFVDLEIGRVIHAWHYTRLDYAEIKDSIFIGDKNAHHQMIFFQNDLSHARFTNCTFQSVIIRGGYCNNAVFSDCSFTDVIFKSNEDERYHDTMFLNCGFRNVDLYGFDIRTCSFWGNCRFENIRIETPSLYSFKSIGSNIIQKLSYWDSNSWSQRRRIKSISHTFRRGVDLPERTITYHDEGHEDKSREKRYVSAIHSYEGLSSFYEYFLTDFDRTGRHDDYIRSHYVLQWLRDEILILKEGRLRHVKVFIARNILGYGDRPWFPLRAWLITVLLFSLGFLFSGVSFQGRSIAHSLSASDNNNFSQVLADLAACFYFSVITSTTVGYGDIQPAGYVSMLLSCLLSILGLLFLTMFTVIFARRFFH